MGTPKLKPVVKLEYKDPWIVYSLSTTDTGMLQCNGGRNNPSGNSVMSSTCRGTDWCQHMEKIVADGTDADLIWDSRDSELDVVQDVVVPIIPTMNQWAKVSLIYQSALVAYKVMYEPHSTESYDPGGEPEEFIGFLHRGEGRLVLRQMLHEYCNLVTATKPDFQCGNPTHSFSAQMSWERNVMESDKMRLAEYWSVIDTGKCLMCNTSGSSDWDDLIPEDGKKNRWP